MCGSGTLECMLTRAQSLEAGLAREREASLLAEEFEVALTMANPAPRALKDYSQPQIHDIQSSIVRPAIAANTFEIKPSTIQMVQNSV